jgi:hypothetical protein
LTCQTNCELQTEKDKFFHPHPTCAFFEFLPPWENRNTAAFFCVRLPDAHEEEEEAQMSVANNGMYQVALVILSADLFVLLLWALEGFMLGALCWAPIGLLVHVVVGIHFGVNLMAVSLVVDDMREGRFEADAAGSTAQRLLPHRFPLGWIIASVVALFGDIFLLWNDVNNWTTGAFALTAQCRQLFIFELFIESFITFNALLSIVLFMALVFEREAHRRAAQNIVPTSTVQVKQQQQHQTILYRTQKNK